MIDVIKLTNFRLILHELIYKDEYYLNKLISIIRSRFDLFVISPDMNNMIITMKIKKTNIKKNHNYTHNVEFYYPIFTEIIIAFLQDDEVKDKLKSNVDINLLNNLYDDLNTNKDSNLNIRLLYNLTPILDNTLILYL